MMKKQVCMYLIFLELYCLCSAIASEKIYELTDTHKLVSRESGEKIYIPIDYDNYNDFKKEYITNLLAERLRILSDFKALYDQKEELEQQKYLSYRNSLDINEDLLRSNLENNNDKLNEVFGDDYNSESIKIDHIRQVALVLKKMISLKEDFKYPKNYLKSLDNLIEQTEVLQKQSNATLILGKNNFEALERVALQNNTSLRGVPILSSQPSEEVVKETLQQENLSLITTKEVSKTTEKNKNFLIRESRIVECIELLKLLEKHEVNLLSYKDLEEILSKVMALYKSRENDYKNIAILDEKATAIIRATEKVSETLRITFLRAFSLNDTKIDSHKIMHNEKMREGEKNKHLNNLPIITNAPLTGIDANVKTSIDINEYKKIVIHDDEFKIADDQNGLIKLIIEDVFNTMELYKDIYASSHPRWDDFSKIKINFIQRDSLDFNFSEKDITEETIVEICKEISKYKKIDSINMQNCNLDDERILELSAYLIDTQASINTLDLRFNKIGDEGAHSLLIALENKKPISVMMAGNPQVSKGLLNQLKGLEAIEEKAKNLDESLETALLFAIVQHKTLEDSQKFFNISSTTINKHVEQLHKSNKFSSKDIIFLNNEWKIKIHETF